jgi:hypothetical protein
MLCTVNGCTNTANYTCVYGCINYHIQKQDLCYLCINSVMRKTLDKRTLCITCTRLIEDLLWCARIDTDSVYALDMDNTRYLMTWEYPLLNPKLACLPGNA